MPDVAVFDYINALSAEEEQLFAEASDGSGLSTAASERLAEIKVELDRCYDLLHQREARRAAGSRSGRGGAPPGRGRRALPAVDGARPRCSGRHVAV